MFGRGLLNSFSSTFVFYASYVLCVIFPVVFLLNKLLNCILLYSAEMLFICMPSLYMFPLLLLIYLLNQLLRKL